MAESESQRIIASIRDYVRRDPLVKYEDVQDIISEAERTGDHIRLIREYSRRRASSVVKPPDYSGMSEAERAAEADGQRNKVLERARLCQAEAKHPAARRLEGLARITDFDPKQGGEYYNRLYYYLGTFDHDEESPHGSMRFTDKVYQGEPNYDMLRCEAVNIFSVKIASLDVAFPIHVYGKVIARDNLDRKCVYLFDRDKCHPQLINSEDESLILTGPKRGLALISDDYVEIDLKIKCDQMQDIELSKGILTIRKITGRPFEKCMVESESLATRLSTVDVTYAVMLGAVEATILVEIIRGEFYGEITAYTTSIKDSLVVHDSKLAGVMTRGGKGVIQLMRPVISVPLKDMLYIFIGTGDGKSGRTIEFTPRLNNAEEDEIFVGSIKMRVKVAWSIIHT